jgi:hypothetical protein
MNAPSKKIAPTVGEVLDEMDAARNLNIAQRIAAVMGEVDYVQKEKKQGMNYSIVSHDAVTAKVRPLLHKHGVIYYPRGLQVQQNGNRTEAVFMVRFENIDDRTDYIDVETIGYGVDPQDKGPGKAISYGVKYALLKVLGLETGDDPDTVQDDRANHEAGPVTRQQKIAEHRDDPFPLGPAKNKTHLKDMGRAFWRDVEACGDPDELDCLLSDKSNVQLVNQIMKALPNWWDGGVNSNGETFEGLEAVIERKRRDFEQLEAAR